MLLVEENLVGASRSTHTDIQVLYKEADRYATMAAEMSEGLTKVLTTRKASGGERRPIRTKQNQAVFMSGGGA